jgi:hypothetical protein
VRSDRLFCQMLDYNILFRWFLDMSVEESELDQLNFKRLRERLSRRFMRCEEYSQGEFPHWLAGAGAGGSHGVTGVHWGR